MNCVAGQMIMTLVHYNNKVPRRKRDRSADNKVINLKQTEMSSWADSNTTLHRTDSGMTSPLKLHRTWHIDKKCFSCKNTVST
ncbi:hypothetical protein HHUSO_G35850 [Huso huso]|uniref:Uncharacterized protein n=1 Tax=Huso huso TaxID=61971 RepID=A0ABR0Y2U3_HUSHU